MEYNKLIAVTGLPGLFELIASKNDGAIVRSLDDKTTKFVSSRIHNFSHLETIEVYTTQENVNLATVFQAMKADSTALPNVKDGAAVKKYFEKVFPDMDFERVFSSDMKKMVKWFEILDQNGVEIKLTEIEEDTDGSSDVPSEEAEPAAKKKAGPAKAEAITDDADGKKSVATKAEGKGKSAKTADEKKAEAAEGKKAAASKKANASKEESAPKKTAKEPKAAKTKDAAEAPKKKASGKKKPEE